MTITIQGLGSVSNGVIVTFGYGDTVFVIFFDTFDYRSSLTTLVDYISHLLILLDKKSPLTTLINFSSPLKTENDEVTPITTEINFKSKLL